MFWQGIGATGRGAGNRGHNGFGLQGGACRTGQSHRYWLLELPPAERADPAWTAARRPGQALRHKETPIAASKARLPSRLPGRWAIEPPSLEGARWRLRGKAAVRLSNARAFAPLALRIRCVSSSVIAPQEDFPRLRRSAARERSMPPPYMNSACLSRLPRRTCTSAITAKNLAGRRGIHRPCRLGSLKACRESTKSGWVYAAWNGKKTRNGSAIGEGVEQDARCSCASDTCHYAPYICEATHRVFMKHAKSMLHSKRELVALRRGRRSGCACALRGEAVGQHSNSSAADARLHGIGRSRAFQRHAAGDGRRAAWRQRRFRAQSIRSGRNRTLVNHHDLSPHMAGSGAFARARRKPTSS